MQCGGQTISREELQSPRSLQSIENNWDYAKGCMAETVDPLVFNTALWPWGLFLCPSYSNSLWSMAGTVANIAARNGVGALLPMGKTLAK